MLQRLIIQNYILIENLEMEFSDNLTTVTGETGAGKSILLGALSLIIGNRADTKVLFDKRKKCVVEGYFDITSLRYKEFFSSNDLDYEDIVILRREINQVGKSRAFINDTPVNLSLLKDLGSNLLDIHSQHETLNLSNSAFQLLVLDTYAGQNEQLISYQRLFKQYQQGKSRLNSLMEQEQQSKRDLDYFQFQFNELKEANLMTGEQVKIESELKTQAHAEEISRKLNSSENELVEKEGSLINQLTTIAASFETMSGYHPKLKQVYERLKSVVIELNDIVDEIADLDQFASYDQRHIEQLTERINLIYGLQQKHRVHTIDELLVISRSLQEKICGISFLEEEINNLKMKLKDQHIELSDLACKLSANRVRQISPIERQVKKMLDNLALENSIFKINRFALPDNQFNEQGIDQIRFLFSANKGGTPMEISQVASGGELSRLMLCIKSLLTEKTSLPTIIFDEIDTGVSGETAFKVGEIMRMMAKNHQVISITHLPQIAGKGDTHFYVYKEVKGGNTYTMIRQLNSDERIVEIAKMIGGDKPTPTAVKNAKELLSN